jgi:dihydrofolate synthase / folylpolyglutamate synthase
MPAVCDYPTALDWLLGRVNYERMLNVPYRAATFKLDRMRRLLALVKDPHLGLRAVHIAGTKGKGSTAGMLAEVLRAAGYRTGLYTSPHLARIEERMAIDGRICPPDSFAALLSELAPAVERVDREEALAGEGRGGPTFFEITTAAAFLHFASERVDVAVLEVGLGGRLDSTNVCQPEVTVITSISYDHVRQLGPTLAHIAGEKAGIIKPGVPVVSGVAGDEPRQVIVRRAAELAAPLFERGIAYDFTVGTVNPDARPAAADARGLADFRQVFDYREPAKSPRYELAGVELSLLGRHQAANAAAAICSVGRLRQRGWSIDDAALRRGLAASRSPARIEVVGQQPTTILDVAHNVAAVEALLEVVREQSGDRRRVLVFASSKDKDHAGMLARLVPQFDAVVFTRYVENPRAMELEQLLAEAQRAQALAAAANGGAVRTAALHVAPTPADAWQLARELTAPEDVLVVTGSFFLAAELRPLLVQGKVDVGLD